mmetsp:Transcript_21874/g.33914  ORF Transcript_21874/g.33914 Transcript_21874/m.33914 type:complete len:130 (+) Transcript_21874:1508-1897(+)
MPDQSMIKLDHIERGPASQANNMEIEEDSNTFSRDIAADLSKNDSFRQEAEGGAKEESSNSCDLDDDEFQEGKAQEGYLADAFNHDTYYEGGDDQDPDIGSPVDYKDIEVLEFEDDEANIRHPDDQASS